ncbi:MAG: hypothetical protein JST00_35605 [Deltaproteobacteria bacterium]|nr:hypothetical protein [Deltaproteobacteria bacterium]
MTHCAKCGTELIGMKKFCAACGAPAGDPRSPVASTGATPMTAGSSSPNVAPAPGSSQDNLYTPAASVSVAGPVSQVNPFAQTAGPGALSSDYGPPPISVPPELASTAPGLGAGRPSQVSPLASSNVNSERGAFHTAGGSAVAQAAQQALEASAARASSPSGAPSPSGIPSGPVPDPSAVKKIPGTQLMPSMQNPPVGSQAQPSAPIPPTSPKKQQGTFVMQMPPNVPGITPSSQGSIPAASSVQPSMQPQPSQAAPLHTPAPHVAPHLAPQPQAPQPPPPVAAPQPPAQAPQAPQPQAWGQANAPAAWSQPMNPYAQPAPYAPQPQAPAAPPPGAYQYGFGYAPGSRVQVTWSNGQRYPGTVQQVSGAQCLVLFPDGQQHWVEMQYVAPA